MNATASEASAIVLSPGQRAALGAARDVIHGSILGHTMPCLFITGNAGTGKSTVLRELRNEFSQLVVASPTGIAAQLVGGETIHSLFGFGIGPKTKGSVRASRREFILKRADALVIDEVSMVRADMMDAMSWCLQKTLKDPRPFGGKAVIFFGDLFQIEPVTGEDWKTVERDYKSPFFFDARVFTMTEMEAAMFDEAGAATLQTHNLTEVFRQRGQTEFLDSLNAIRQGDPSGLAFVNERVGGFVPTDPAPPVLTFTNARAENINRIHMERLTGEERTFVAEVDGEGPGEKELPVPFTLKLKIGARVMVCRNLRPDDEGEDEKKSTKYLPPPGAYPGWGEIGIVANGTMGEIVGFTDDGPVVDLDDGRTIVVPQATWEKAGYARDHARDSIITILRGRFSQIPLKPAWAVTVHKSQGQTLDSAILEIESAAHAHGQIYVALSRVRSFDRLYLRRRIQPSDLIVRDRVKEFLGVVSLSVPTLDLEWLYDDPPPPAPEFSEAFLAVAEDNALYPEAFA